MFYSFNANQFVIHGIHAVRIMDIEGAKLIHRLHISQDITMAIFFNRHSIEKKMRQSFEEAINN